jgi:RNA polymerase sigma-70 factor, ECF subfamily
MAVACVERPALGTTVSTAVLRCLARMAPDPDTALVDRSRAGDLDAFAALVERHQDVVRRVAARVVGAGDADDVTQDAFLRAFHRLGRFRGEGSFRAWLLQITYNTALTALDRRRPVTEAVDGDGDGAPADSDRRRMPVEQLEDGERRRRLELKLRSLRPAHRAVLVLRDVEGLSYDEIAAVTDTPLGSVKGRLHRARRELIDLMRRNTYDWELPE